MGGPRGGRQSPVHFEDLPVPPCRRHLPSTEGVWHLLQEGAGKDVIPLELRTVLMGLSGKPTVHILHHLNHGDSGGRRTASPPSHP